MFWPYMNIFDDVTIHIHPSFTSLQWNWYIYIPVYTRTSSIKSIGQANATQLVLVFLLLQRELSMLALTLVFIIKLHVKYVLNSVVLWKFFFQLLESIFLLISQYFAFLFPFHSNYKSKSLISHSQTYEICETFTIFFSFKSWSTYKS